MFGSTFRGPVRPVRPPPGFVLPLRWAKTRSPRSFPVVPPRPLEIGKRPDRADRLLSGYGHTWRVAYPEDGLSRWAAPFAHHGQTEDSGGLIFRRVAPSGVHGGQNLTIKKP